MSEKSLLSKDGDNNNNEEEEREEGVSISRKDEAGCENGVLLSSNVKVKDKKDKEDGGGDKVKGEDRWSVYFDDNTMKPYYYNWTTGVTTWDKPKGANLSSMGAVQTQGETEYYEARATFKKLGGGFDAADGLSHWDRTGIPSNRTDRQMSIYMDITQLEGSNSTGQKRKKPTKPPTGKTWKEYNAKKKAKKAKRVLES